MRHIHNRSRNYTLQSKHLIGRRAKIFYAADCDDCNWRVENRAAPDKPQRRPGARGTRPGDLRCGALRQSPPRQRHRRAVDRLRAQDCRPGMPTFWARIRARVAATGARCKKPSAVPFSASSPTWTPNWRGRGLSRHLRCSRCRWPSILRLWRIFWDARSRHPGPSTRRRDARGCAQCLQHRH